MDAAGDVAADVTVLAEERLGGLTVEREAALRRADNVLPVHSAGKTSSRQARDFQFTARKQKNKTFAVFLLRTT